MKNCFRRFLALALVCLLAAGTAPLALASDDVLTRSEALEIILSAADDYGEAAAQDVLQGGREDEAVTRAEILVMLSRAFGELSEPVGDSARSGADSSALEDVPGWAKTQLANILSAGIVTANEEGAFGPRDTVSRQELETLIGRIYALEGSNLKDDFYANVNKEWLAGAAIPAGSSMTGTLYEVMDSTDRQVARLIEEIAASDPEKGSPEEKIKNLYENILDWDARNEAGIEPIQPWLDAIDGAEDLDALMAVSNDLLGKAGVGLAYFATTQNVEDSSGKVLAFAALSSSLTKDFYAMEGVEELFTTYVDTLFQLGGASEEEAAAMTETYVAMDKDLAGSRMSQEDMADFTKIFNFLDAQEVKDLYPNVDLETVQAAMGLHDEDRYVVSDVELMKKSAEYFTEEHLEELKIYLRLSVLSNFGELLNREFSDAAEAYNAALMGVEGSLSDEENAAQEVQQYLADYLGQVYVEKHFSAEAKADVESMIDEILEVYAQRIEKLDWMSETTKAKAIEKLEAITVNVGYPDKWDDLYDDVDILSAADGGSYFDNILAMTEATLADMAAAQDDPVDRGEWLMSVYTVNAYYSPQNNSINFPAGILQSPLYDVEADRTENLGGIGYVIAHEISHAFDNNGATFDAQGNQSDWWTEADYAAFQELCQQVIDFYDGVEAAPGIVCNGTLTLSENVADLGALACITDLEGQEEEPDYETLYRTAARTWRGTASRETRAYLAMADVHAPDKLRGSRALQSLDEFYETFGIQSGDGMYLPEEARVQIW
ncbi:MAG: M13 family metallopeptidase [Oscillospiraceae bacterium]|nr:M13 family metallopeptidase [Oscillospiraceae bacterium]